MFTEESIAKIFSNIEQIYEFHLEILMQFEDCFVEDDPCASEIGSVFLNNVSLLCSNLAKTGFDSTSNEYNCEHMDIIVNRGFPLFPLFSTFYRSMDLKFTPSIVTIILMQWKS